MSKESEDQMKDDPKRTNNTPEKEAFASGAAATELKEPGGMTLLYDTAKDAPEGECAYARAVRMETIQFTRGIRGR